MLNRPRFAGAITLYIMFVIPELKLNSFKEETIPSPSDLFARFGFTTKKGAMTGDESPKTGLSKVETLAEVEKLAIDND